MLKSLLNQLVLKNLEKYDFQETDNKRYSYYKITEKYGELGLSFEISKYKGKNTLTIFMMFSDVKKALKTGFSCNIYSGKYNFHTITELNQIEYIFSLIE